jgi:hypothetical protein
MSHQQDIIRKEKIGPILACICLFLILVVYGTWSVKGDFILGLPFSTIAMYILMIIGVVVGILYFYVTKR